MAFEVSAAAYIAEVPSYIPVVNHRFVRMVPQKQEKELDLEVCAHSQTYTNLQRIRTTQNWEHPLTFCQEDVTFKECYLHLVKLFFYQDAPEYIHVCLAICYIEIHMSLSICHMEIHIGDRTNSS